MLVTAMFLISRIPAPTEKYTEQEKSDQKLMQQLRAWCPNDELVFQLESATGTVGYFGCVKK